MRCTPSAAFSMMGPTASRNPCTCSHKGRKLSLPSKRSSTVTTVPGCVCGKGAMQPLGLDYEGHVHSVRLLEPGTPVPQVSPTLVAIL